MPKNIWDDIKEKMLDGFKPMSARADANIKRNREETGNQLAEDMKQSPEERARKFREGFLKKIGHDPSSP